jgi:excisionase family DNA binding protein
MLTVPEAAIRVGRNPETVRRWIRGGRLPATRIGTQLLIDEGQLAALIGAGHVVRESPARSGTPSMGDRVVGGDVDQTVIVHLDAEHSARLVKIAERIHLSPESVARSLLSTALDQRDPDAAVITAVLDAIPGAWESAQAGLAEIRAGRGIPLDDL